MTESTNTTVVFDLPADVPCKLCGSPMVESVPAPGIVWSVVCSAAGCPYALRLRSA